MKKSVVLVLMVILLSLLFGGCASNRKYQSELRGLMLQDNLKLGRNKAYFSKHNVKLKKNAFRQYRKNNRNL